MVGPSGARSVRTLSLAILLAAASAAGQGEVLGIRYLQGLVEVRHDVLQTEVEPAGLESRRERLEDLSPHLSLRVGGHLIDPRIVTFDLGAGGRIERGSLDRDEEKQDLSAEGFSYDIGLGLLPQNRFSLLVRAVRFDGVREYPYAVPTAVTSRTSRVELGMRRVFLPGTLAFDRSDLVESVDGPLAIGTDRHQRSIEYRGSRVQQGYRLDVLARRLELEERVLASGSNRNDSLHAALEFWQPLHGVTRWSTVLDYFARSGAGEQRTYSLAESAGLRHGENLTSDHSLAVRRDESLGSRDDVQTTYNWSSGVRHQLFDSLETQLRFGASRVEQTLGGQTNLRGEGGVSYRKQLPWQAALHAGWRQRREDHRLDAGAGSLRVIDEPHVGRIAAPFALERSNVIPATIVVASEGGSILYREGIDWVASAVGAQTEIVVLPSGAIVDGQPLRVSYRVEQAASSRSVLELSSWDVALSWRGLSLFYDRAVTDETVTPAVPDQFRRDQTESTYGVRGAWNRSGWSANLEAMQLERADRLVAYERRTVAGAVGGSIGRRLTFGIGGQQSSTIFSRPARERDVLSGNLNLTWRPVGTLTLGARVEYRELRDTPAFEESYVAEILSLSWSYGRLSISGSAGVYDLERNGSRQKTFRSVLNLVRRI